MPFHLKNTVRALLMSTSEAVSIRDVQTVITRYHQQIAAGDAEPEDVQALAEGGVPSLLPASAIREAFDALAAELAASGDVCRIVQGPSGYRMTIAPEFALWVRLFRNEEKPVKLSQAALETLAIVAYRQPVTRAEAETIRGVSSDSAFARLQELELITVTGRADLPGRPLQFGTTVKFLEYAGLTSLEALPASDVLSRNQLSEWMQRANAEKTPAGNREMGLDG